MLILVLQESTAEEKKKEALLIRFHLFLSMWPSRVASPFSHPHTCAFLLYEGLGEHSRLWGCGAAWQGLLCWEVLVPPHW